jgi:hypothetical protein
VTRRSADTAETLILIGLIFQGITLIVLLGVGLFFLIIPILGGFVLFLAILALIWLILVYVFSYLRTVNGDYDGARSPTLVFGILALITGGIVSGILYIVAAVKLADAADEKEARTARPTPSAVSPTYSPYTSSSPTRSTSTPLPQAFSPPTSSPVTSGSNFCSNCGRPTPPQAHFCRNCGATLQ